MSKRMCGSVQWWRMGTEAQQAAQGFGGCWPQGGRKRAVLLTSRVPPHSNLASQTANWKPLCASCHFFWPMSMPSLLGLQGGRSRAGQATAGQDVSQHGTARQLAARQRCSEHDMWLAGESTRARRHHSHHHFHHPTRALHTASQPPPPRPGSLSPTSSPRAQSSLQSSCR
jgi:hypothetical protein